MAEQFNQGFAVRAVGAGADESITVIRPLTVYDALVIATNGGAGTMTVKLTSAAGTAISSAMNPGSTDTSLTRTTSVNDAANSLVSGDVLYFDVSAGTLNYEAYAYVFPAGIAG